MVKKNIEKVVNIEMIEKNTNNNNKNDVGIIIIEKTGNVKELKCKNFLESELYKKCNFKKPDNFIKIHEWNVKINQSKLTVKVYGKEDGKAGTENKYDYPPPIDTELYFGNMCIVGYERKENKQELITLTKTMWLTIYEKLFGGFENLSSTAIEDELEEDELENIPSSKKTKTGGYYKDGFVVDSGDNIDSEDENDSNYNDDDTIYETDDNDDDNNLTIPDIKDDEILNGSELSEEEYSDDE
jgi:hypothetical protein